MTQRLDDGHSTTFTFAAQAGVKMYEKQVQPPGVQGGGANPTTTMLNDVWRTNAPKHLKTMANMTAKVAYDVAVYPQVVSLININTLITINFPDGSTLSFWGWLDEFTPDNVQEGAQPEASVTIIPSNQNAAGEETAPTYTTPAPTTTTAA